MEFVGEISSMEKANGENKHKAVEMKAVNRLNAGKIIHTFKNYSSGAIWGTQD